MREKQHIIGNAEENTIEFKKENTIEFKKETLSTCMEV